MYWLQGSNAQQTVYKDAQRHEVKLRGNGKSLFSLQYRAENIGFKKHYLYLEIPFIK